MSSARRPVSRSSSSCTWRDLDNWDPRVVDGIAAKRRVITFDNRGVGASTGKTPDTIQAMAKDAVTFIRALGFDQVDLHGFSMGGMIGRTGDPFSPTFTQSTLARPREKNPLRNEPR